MSYEWPVYSHLSGANELSHIQSVTACESPKISCALDLEDSYRYVPVGPVASLREAAILPICLH